MGICTKFNPLGASRQKAYKKGTVVFESKIPGTYQLELLFDGRYLVYCVAGGAALYEEYGKGGDVIGITPQQGTPGYVS